MKRAPRTGRPRLEVETRPITLRLPADLEAALRKDAGAATIQAVILRLLRAATAKRR